MKRILSTVAAVLLLASVASLRAADRVVEDFSAFDASTLSFLGGSGGVENGALHVHLDADRPYPHAMVKRALDLGDCLGLRVDLTNTGRQGLTVSMRIDNKGATGSARHSSGTVTLAPGERGVLVAAFNRESPNGFRDMLEGMNGYPDGTKSGAALDPSAIVAFQFFGNRPTAPMDFVVHRIEAFGDFSPDQLKVPDPFFPFLDGFGQYRHRTWPGKTLSDEDFAKVRAEEEADLAAHPAPASFDALGGWKDGPVVAESGHFRTVKHDGRWWFVTPEGHLFWSLGVDCVRVGGDMFIDQGRESWFESLPDEASALGAFYGAARGRNAGGKLGDERRTFDFGAANAYRKYGAGWEKASIDLAARRLPSWGFNTYGCWSLAPYYKAGRMPYVCWVYHATPRIRSWGVINKAFPDVFHPAFAEGFRRSAKNMLAAAKDDPRCIGVFSDNELPWMDDDTLARAILKAPEDQPAKQRMVEWLKERYSGDLAALNAAWKTEFPAWDDLLPSVAPPTAEGARDDLVAFTDLVADTYFRTCRDILAEEAPELLYLGCRFASHNARLVQTAAKYCDVLSFNIYRQSVSDWAVPGGVDKPVLIGEFHFGAPDRGPFGCGLVAVPDQAERADAIRRYLDGAMRHPNFVGAHWFQYSDEATAGRPLDGENYQIGLVDICDTPYAETVSVFREMGERLYRLRSGAK